MRRHETAKCADAFSMPFQRGPRRTVSGSRTSTAPAHPTSYHLSPSSMRTGSASIVWTRPPRAGSSSAASSSAGASRSGPTTSSTASRTSRWPAGRGRGQAEQRAGRRWSSAGPRLRRSPGRAVRLLTGGAAPWASRSTFTWLMPGPGQPPSSRRTSSSIVRPVSLDATACRTIRRSDSNRLPAGSVTPPAISSASAASCASRW